MIPYLTAGQRDELARLNPPIDYGDFPYNLGCYFDQSSLEVVLMIEQGTRFTKEQTDNLQSFLLEQVIRPATAGTMGMLADRHALMQFIHKVSLQADIAKRERMYRNPLVRCGYVYELEDQPSQYESIKEFTRPRLTHPIDD